MQLTDPQRPSPASSSTPEVTTPRGEPVAPTKSRRTSGMEIDPADWVARPFIALAHLLMRYHRHRVVHLERLGKLLEDGRRVVIVANHALDVVDPLLFVAQVLERYGRVPRFIGHEVTFFKIPILRDIARRFKVLPSRRPEETARALREDGLLMLFPGAVTEAGLRVYRDEPYRLKWEGRAGFLRLALEHDAEVVFLATVGNDEMYFQTALPIPRVFLTLFSGGDARYAGMRLRLGLLGMHVVPGLFPLPVQLTQFVSPPLDLGDRRRALADPRAFAKLHRSVWRRCQRFLDASVARRTAYSDPIDRLVRQAERTLQGFGI
jgi:1-acyl-sn-glycerol-3-phosphate acyltransferase